MCGVVHTLHVCEPVGLVVVLGGDGERVEEHQQDDQPVEGGGLDRQTTLPAREAVPAPPVPTAMSPMTTTSSRGQSPSHTILNIMYTHHVHTSCTPTSVIAGEALGNAE